MKTNTIITIGREYGSAGREIGYKVADAFGIKLYDKEMLSRAAKESGICEEIFETHDEKPTNSFLYSLVMDTYSMGYSGNTYTDMPINHKVFLASLMQSRRSRTKGRASWSDAARTMRWSLTRMWSACLSMRI